MLDAVNHRIVIVDLTAGQVAGEIAYSDRYYPSQLAFDGKVFHLLDHSRQRHVLLDAGGTLVSDTLAPEDATLIQNGANAQVKVRTAPQRHEASHGEAISLAQAEPFTAIAVTANQKFAIESKHLLGGADLLGADDNGYYFIVEELLDAPTITAERSVRWYDRNGNLKGVYEVPFWEYFAYPNTDLAFDPKTGAIYNMIPREEAIELRKVSWTAPEHYQGRLSRLAADVSTTDEPTTQDDVGVAAGWWPRTNIVNTANAYASKAWTASKSNWNGSTSDGWRRPRYIEAKNRSYSTANPPAGVPYGWGGHDTLSQFDSYIANGRRAGDVNTVNGRKSNITGVDCSGFIQNTWGLTGSKRNCASLENYGKSINTSQLAVGDALSSAAGDRHCLLYRGASGSTAILTWESTVTNQLDRVVRHSRTWSYLNSRGYKALRHPGVCEAGQTCMQAVIDEF